MKLDMYQATVPPCTRALANLGDILTKAESHAGARKIEASVLLNTRLFPDMLPLTSQILIASDIVRGGAARLAAVDVPVFTGEYATFPALIEWLRRSIAFVNTLTPAQFEGAEDRTISWNTRSSSKSMQGTQYLFNHVLPNVYFHVTTAYDILRQAGVELGKADYLGKT